MSKIDAKALTDLAFTAVKEMILSEELKPGEKIVQDKLASELGISRTPLRSALQMLEGEELVQSVPRRGMFVRKLSDQEMVDIFDCRIALEHQAVTLFTQRSTELHIDQLASFFLPYQNKDFIDAKKYRLADLRFHQHIIAHCGNAFLHRLFDKSNLLTFIDRMGLIRPPEDTIAEHLAIIKAIRDRDTKWAGLQMRKHLLRSREIIENRILEGQQT